MKPSEQIKNLGDQLKFCSKLVRKTFRNHPKTTQMVRKAFQKDWSFRHNQLRQKLVEIGAILAIFRPFEIFPHDAAAPRVKEFSNGLI